MDTPTWFAPSNLPNSATIAIRVFSIRIVLLSNDGIKLMNAERQAAALDRIRTFAAQLLERNEMVGLQIALTDCTGPIDHLELGDRNLDSKAPVLPETQFEFGSIG
jgi:hypothetical protein